MKKDKEKYISKPASLTPGRYIIPVTLILVFTFIAYLPSLKNNFTNWDDPNYVYHNPHIQIFNKENIKELISADYMGNYHPITMLSLAIDHSIGKLKPKTYHTTNLILHLCNTALVFILILLLFEKIEIASVTAALFGLHTLHVESVAWISERKDVLYTLFFLASLIFYLRYLKEEKNKFYFISLALFILSDLSKGMAVSLSLSLLAIDWLKGRDFRDTKVILEKIPYFILSIFFGIIAISAQKLGPETEGIPHYNIFERIVFASYGFCQYLYKLILPINLSAFYPYPEKGAIPFTFWICLIISIAVAAAAFYSARRSREYLFCFLFFSFNIILVLQILPVGRAIMADRYAYVPSIGFFLATAITFSRINAEKIFKIVLIGAYLLLLTTFTYNRCKIWQDNFSLWTDVIEKYPAAAIAYNNRGVAYAEVEKYNEALSDYNKAVDIDPKHAEAYSNRGVTKAALKDFTGAKQDYNKAIELRPFYPDAYYNRGNIFKDLNDTSSAIRDYTKVLSINPSHSGALNNRGLERRLAKDYKGALEDLNKAIKINPANAEAYANRALVEMDLGDISGAQQDNEKAVKLDPNFGTGYLQRADAKNAAKDFSGALADYNLVLQRDANNAEALFKRAVIKITFNDNSGAITDLSRVIAIIPGNVEAHIQRGIAKNNLKDHQGAIADYNKALEIKPGSAEVYSNRGIAKYDLSDLKGALEDYNKATTLKPDFAEVFCNRGLLKASLKDNKGALADYDKAISLKPDFALAYNNRGVLKYNTGNTKGACPDWKKGMELGDPNSKNFYERFCK
jgi:protein O-mannosyl-transferase